LRKNLVFAGGNSLAIDFDATILSEINKSPSETFETAQNDENRLLYAWRGA